MKVLAVNCFEEPKVIEIENTLKALQLFVCGDIEYISLSETAGLICNEEGKLKKMRANRPYCEDLIFGDFLICGIDGTGDFTSLSEDDILKYSSQFKLRDVYEMRLNDNHFMTVNVSEAGTGKGFVAYDLLQAKTETPYKFLSYDFAKKNNFSLDAYESVYKDIIPEKDVCSMCENLYMEHNTIIADRKSHSMSVSDIIVFHFSSGNRYFYTDSFGFKEIMF